MPFEKLKRVSQLLFVLLFAGVFSASVLAQNEPAVEIEKSAAETNVTPGDLIHYTIKPRLKTGNEATNVVITDPLSAETILVSVTGGGVYDAPGHTVTWTFPYFHQGEKPSFELVVQVDPATTATEVVNTASITADDRVPDDSTVIVPIEEAPFIALSKTANVQFVGPGDQFTFTIAYQNTGNLEAINAVLSDPLPADTNYVDSTLGGIYDPGTRTVTWPADNLNIGDGGELLLILQVDLAAVNGTVITNTASMAGDNFVTATAIGRVTVQVAPLLSLVKTTDSIVTGPDEHIDYLLEFANVGNAVATGATLEDALPQDTFFVSASGGGQFDGTSVVWDLGDLQASETGSVTMTVLVRGSISPADDIAILNTATLDASNATLVTASVSVPVIAQAVLEMTKTANSDFADPGALVFYTIRYENTGTASADNLILSDRVPQGMTFVSATAGGTLVGDEVTWTDPDLVPGAVGQVQLVLQLDPLLVGGSTIINTASIDSDGTLPVAASATITVRRSPSLKVIKSANVEFTQPGSFITYTIEYTNRGNEDATAVTIEDLLPLNTTFVTASGGGVFSNGKVDWAFPKLGIGETGSVTMTVQVGAAIDDSIIRNDVTLDSENALAVSAFHETSVRQAAVLKLLKTASFAFVAPGQEITFTLPYENTGNVAATNVIIEDYLPRHMTFVTASGGGVYDPVDNKVVWTEPALDVGAFGQVQLTLRVDAATANDTVITNSATINSDNTSPVTASESFIVKVSPNLRLIKIAAVKITGPGDQITYTLDFTNTGNATATDTILEDLLPDHTSFVSASGGGTLADNKVVWTLQDLGVHELGSVTLTVLVDDPVPDGTVINNVATLDSSNAFAVSADNQVIIDLLPTLNLIKSASREFVEAGEEVSFELEYSNSGNALASNIVLTDAVPGGMTFVSATGGGTLIDGVVRWTDPGLDVGAIGRVQLTLKVDESVADNTVIHNFATMTSNETPPVSASDSVTVKRTPVLELDVTASLELVNPGEEITFTLDLTNVGNATAINLTLENAIPAGTTFVSATGGGILNNGFVTWTGFELPIGVPASAALVVRVDDTVADGMVINNTATADAINSYAVTASTSVVVQRRPILNLTKTANSDFVEAGAQTTFTMGIKNTGSGDAINLVLEDEISLGTVFISASSGGIYDPVSNKVNWSIALLQVGQEAQVTLTIEADPGLADSTVIHNSATLNSDNSQPITASDSVIVKRSPVLSVSKTSNVDFIGPGETLTYVIDYINTGNASATDVIIEDVVPANTSYLSHTGGGVFSTDRVIWNFASLPVGEQGSVSLTVLVDAAVTVDNRDTLEDGTIIRNTVSMDSTETYAISAEDEVVVKFSPALTIEKNADRTVAIPGDTITYYITVENTGNITATNVILEDTLPDNTSFVSASDGGIESAGIVTWLDPKIAVGEKGTVTLLVLLASPLDDGTVVHDSSAISSDQTFAVSADHTLFVQSSPQLSVAKTADQTVVIPGDTITYTLVVNNTGNANANQGLLQDQIPSNTSFVSASSGGSFAAGIVSWSMPSILVGVPQVVTLTVQAASPLDNGTLIYNTASLQSANSAPTGTSHSLYVQSAPLMTLDKTVDKSVVKPGEQLLYTLAYGNNGNANASNTLLKGLLPANTSFVSASDGGSLSGDIVLWDLATLNAGDSGTVTYIVQVDTPLSNGTWILSLGSLNSDEATPVVDLADSVVQSAPVLNLDKVADKTIVDAGQQLVYTISYSNTGNANATGVNLVDTLPANTTFVAASDGGTESNGMVTWPIGLINAGSNGSVTLTVAVDSPLDNATILTNTASLSSNEILSVVAAAEVTVQSSPDISLVKTASVSLAQPGDSITYTLTFGNSGNANASNPVLTDAIPANTTLSSATGGGIFSNGVVTWTGNSILAGSSSSVTMTVLIDTPLNDGTVISNLASLATDQTSSVDSSVDVTIESAPLLTLEKTASASVVNPGDLVTYTLSIANTGNANATNVILTDVVPTATSFVSATGDGIEAGGIVTWNAAELPVGIPASVTMTVMVDPVVTDGTLIKNTAILTSDETGEVNAIANITVESTPVLSLTKTADKTVVKPGEQITYTLALGNSGNENATAVVLTDTIPANTTFVTATGPWTENAGVVTWTATELPVGIPASVTLTVKVNTPLDSGTSIVNNASLDSTETEPVTASHTLNVQSTPVLSLTKSADKTVVNPGDQITYTLSLDNTGNSNASNIVLEDTIPVNTTFSSASNGGTEAGGVVTWTTAELPVGVPASVTLTVDVNTPLDNGTTIYNSATLNSDEAAPISADHSLAVQSAPVLGLSKTADKTVVNPGDQITYTLTFNNTGNANASNIMLEDTIPDYTSYVSSSPAGTESGGVVTWTTAELLVGTEGSVTLTVLVNSPLDNGTPIYNSATLSSDETAPVSAEHSMAVQSSPVLTLVKTADKTVVNPGETITYTLTLGNTGNANASSIILEDTIPANTSYVSSSPEGTESGGVVTWTAAQLLAGAEGAITLTVLVDSPLDNGTPITNSATLDSEETAPVSASHELAVQSAPVLTLVKTADKTVVNPGDQIIYTLTPGNTGNANASNIVLEDTLPAFTSFVAASGGGTETGGVVTWSAAELLAGAEGSVTLTVLVDTPLDNGTTISNSATLESAQTAPISASHELAVQSAAVLTLTKTADKTVASPGDTITYTLGFTNNGNANASTVMLEDTLPANTTFVSAPGAVESGGIITWTLGDMDVGSSGSVALTVQVNTPLDNGTSINNSASLSSDQTVPVTASHALTVQSAPVLSINKTADKTNAKPGDQITYSLEITNSGNANANNVVLQDTLPADSTFVSASGTGAETAGTVTWNITSLLVGIPQTVTVTIMVNSPLDNGTLIYNSATLQSDEAGPVSADHSLYVQSAPVLSIGKTVDKTVVDPGEQLTYTLSYSNSGDANATNAMLIDPLPVNTSFVSASDGGSLSAGVISWSLGTLAAGTNGSVTLVVTVDTPLANNTVISNTVSLESNQTTPVSANASSTVQSAPVLTLDKTADKTIVNAGQQLVYTLQYANSGNANATAVTLIDTLPANTTFVAASDGGTELNGEVTWSIGSINAGASGSVTLTVAVDSPLDNATVLTNTALLNSTETVPVVASVQVTVQSAPDISLVKTASASLAQPGDSITYTLTFGNSGNANASNPVLTDAIPTNTTFSSATGGGTEAGGVVTWSGTSLLAGGSVSVTMTVLIDTPLADGTVISNLASLVTTETTAVDSSVDVTIDSAPVLTLEKTASASVVQPGDLLTYTLNIANTGNANASNVVLTDIVPVGTSFVSTTGGGTESAGTVTWTAVELPVGIPASVTMTVMVDLPLTNGTIITNTASLSSGQTSDVVDSVDVVVDSAPVLSLAKTADKTVVNPGEQITYTLSLGNSGNANATDVVLIDTIPANTTFISTTGGGFEAGGVVTWTATGLLVGASGSVTLTVLVNTPLDNGTGIINNATLSSAETNPISASHTLNVQSTPVLTLTKTADKTVVKPDEQITYTLMFGNVGNANASNVRLEDTLPANTTFVSASGGGTETGGVVTWTTAELLVGSSGAVTLTVLVNTPLDDGTLIYNSATLSSAETTAVSADHSLAVQSAPVLTLSKSADKTVVNPGDEITYTLTFNNTGDENASNVMLEDTLPLNTTFVSASAGGTESGGIVSWTTPELLVGVSGSVTLTVLVDNPLDNGTPIYNSATLSSDETAPVSADHSLAIQSAPVLTLAKTADKTVVNPGEQITYTLTFTNTGNANASDVLLEDTLPANTSFVSASGTGVEAGGIVTWAAPELPVGSTASVTITVLVDTPLNNGTTIYNSATLESLETIPVSADHSLTVQSAPVLTLEKTADKTLVNPNDLITYTLAFANTGNANASGVLLEDAVPANTSFVSATGGGVEAGGLVSWSLDIMDAGTSGSVAMVVQVNNPLDNGTVISNSATLESTQTVPVSASHELSVQSSPVLTVTKTGDKTVASPGESITYQIDFGNTGNANVSNAVLTDTLPADTTFVFASGGGTESGGIVTWPATPVPANASGTAVVVVSVDSPLANATVLHNVVDLVAAGEAVPVTAFFDTVVQSAPAPEITKTADVSFVQKGEIITYTITYANSGTDALLDATLSDVLPTNTTFVSASDGGTFDGSSINWNLGQLAAGSSGTVTSSVRAIDSVVDGDIVTNVAYLDSSNASPVAATVSVPVLGAASLQISKTANIDLVSPGEQVVYSIDYTNTGNATATGITIEDAIPALTTFVSASGNGTLTNGVVNWSPADLAPGESASVTLTVAIDATAANNTVTNNTASINSSGTSPVSASKAVTVFDPVAAIPVLQVDLTPDRPEINAGEEVSYAVDYGNIASADALDLKIVAFLPANVVFVSASTGGVYQSSGSAQWISWDMGTLPGGQTGQAEYRVRHIDSSTALGGNQFSATNEVINALVSASASNTLPITNDTDTATVLVRPAVVPPVEVMPVDTLNPWALLLMMMLLMIPAYRRVR